MAPPRKPYRSRNSKRQTRIQFSSLPASSPDKKDYSPAVQDRLSRVTYTGSRASPRDRSRTDVETPSLPDSSSQPPHDMNEDDSSQLSDPPPTPPTSSLSPALLDEEDDDDELLTPASKRRKTRQDATETTLLSTPLRRSARIDKSSPLPTQSDSRSRSSRGIEVVTNASHGPSSDIGEPETTDDDADVLASRPIQRRRAKAAGNDTYLEPRQGTRASGTSKHQSNEDNWLVDDDEVEYISSDEEAPQEVLKSAKTSRTVRRRHRREQDEIEADLEDLQDSENDQNGESESDNMRRTRGGPVTTQRDQAKEHFELLKRRRAGEKIPRVLDSDDDQSQNGQDINLIGRPADDFSDQGSVHSSIDTDPEEEEAPVADDGVDDFIEEDDDQDMGSSRRPQSGIPLEFTNWMSAKPRDLFPHIVEWLIKNRIAPAFPRNDDIFRLAFQRVNDQVAAQAGSRLISSAWNAEFKFTILARPQIAISLMPGMDEDHIRTCDACNKTNRPAKYDFVLSGEAYNKDTLEPVERDSEDEDDDADDASVDDKGHILAPQDRHFYLGTHCAANAQMGHKLTHWKYHLNETILEYLEEQGVLSAEAIVLREKKNKRKREKEAEAILDAMEEIGKIDELWTRFQRDLKDAMLGMEDYTVRGGKSQGRVGVVRANNTDGRTREWTFTPKGKDKYRERMTREDSPW